MGNVAVETSATCGPQSASATRRPQRTSATCGMQSASATSRPERACLPAQPNCSNGADRADLLQIKPRRRAYSACSVPSHSSCPCRTSLELPLKLMSWPVVRDWTRKS